MPEEARAAAARSDEACKVGDTSKPIVLVVDDDPAVRSSLKFALELEGYDVQAYPDATALLGAADLAQSRCLVIDLKLPGMDGLELLDELRRRRVTAPALLITSHPSRITQERAALRRVPIVEKPLLNQALSDGIHRALENTARQ
jgi:two-component system, LuxR family, response regulator FixJ